MWQEIWLTLMLRRRWKWVMFKEDDRFIIGEDFVDAVVTRGRGSAVSDPELDGFVNDRTYVNRSYQDRTFAMQLNARETKALYHLAKSTLREGAPGESIREEMKAMAIRVLDGKAIMGHSSSAPYYVALVVAAVILLGIIWLIWSAA